MTFARRVFTIAAIYGILALTPQYFLEEQVGRDYPPPITHPEHFYGFVGLALVWQFVFLLIARDPGRYRPVMPLAMLEKLAFGLPAIILFLQGRIHQHVLFLGLLDLALGALFVISYIRTRPA